MSAQSPGRPQLNFGQRATLAISEALGFAPANPLCCALVVSTPSSEDNVIVLELLDPIYDEDAGPLIYEANDLGEYTAANLAPVADGQQDQELAAEFAHTSLFISNCPDATSRIIQGEIGINVRPIPGGPYGFCWSWDPLGCYPCNPSITVDGLSDKCNSRYADCGNSCVV